METINIINTVPADIHTHSTLSPDGCDTPEAMAERAYQLGIKHYALTDHIENEKLESWGYLEAIEKSFEVYKSLSERYKGKMAIYYGAELGQALYNKEQAEKILSEHEYDFVLGSCHRSKSYKRLDKIPSNAHDVYACLDEYYEEMLALAEWGKFSVLSHLTFPLRFISGDVGGFDVDMSRYDSIIEKIMQTIIRNGIAMEVNSSGIRKGLHVPMPSAEYIKKYRDLGGKLITVGSDAHRACDVGADIPTVIAILKDIGCNEICVFKRKQPILIKI